MYFTYFIVGRNVLRNVFETEKIDLNIVKDFIQSKQGFY